MSKLSITSPIFWLTLLLIAITSCTEVEEHPDNPEGNFEALWQMIDRHYCFMLDKNIDWNEVHARYAARMRPQMTQRQLFDLLSEMLGELKDGHVNLSSPMATSF